MNSITANIRTLNVLVVDDDEGIGEMIARPAKELECRFMGVTDSHLAITACERFNPDIIFLDLCMPELDGIQVMHALADAGCNVPLVIMTGLKQRLLNSALQVARSQKLSVVTTIQKPFGRNDIKTILSDQIEKHCVEMEIEAQNLNQTSQATDLVLPGPSLQYEPITQLRESAGATTHHFRMHFVWHTDQGHDISFRQMMLEEHRSSCSSGLVNLMLSKLHLEICMNPGIQALQLHFHFALHPEFLLRPEKVCELINIVKANGFEPDSFTLEMDEKTVLMNPECVQENMTSLELHGFRTALVCADDSDTILAQIKHMPVDELQIDLSTNQLLNEKSESSEADFWLGSLVSFAKKEELCVSLRNINSNSQWQLASNCNVDSVSGSLFGDLQRSLSAERAWPRVAAAQQG